MTVTWEHVLSDCEARLDAASSALELGLPAEVTPFSATEVAEPIPAELADRARVCVARGEALEAPLVNELERVRSELRRLPRMPRAEREARFETHV